MSPETFRAFGDELEKTAIRKLLKPIGDAFQKMQRASLGGSFVGGAGTKKGLEAVRRIQQGPKLVPPRGAKAGVVRPPAEDPFVKMRKGRKQTSGLELAPTSYPGIR